MAFHKQRFRELFAIVSLLVSVVQCEQLVDPAIGTWLKSEPSIGNKSEASPDRDVIDKDVYQNIAPKVTPPWQRELKPRENVNDPETTQESEPAYTTPEFQSDGDTTKEPEDQTETENKVLTSLRQDPEYHNVNHFVSNTDRGGDAIVENPKKKQPNLKGNLDLPSPAQNKRETPAENTRNFNNVQRKQHDELRGGQNYPNDRFHQTHQHNQRSNNREIKSRDGVIELPDLTFSGFYGPFHETSPGGWVYTPASGGAPEYSREQHLRNTVPSSNSEPKDGVSFSRSGFGGPPVSYAHGNSFSAASDSSGKYSVSSGDSGTVTNAHGHASKYYSAPSKSYGYAPSPERTPQHNSDSGRQDFSGSFGPFDDAVASPSADASSVHRYYSPSVATRVVSADSVRVDAVAAENAEVDVAAADTAVATADAGNTAVANAEGGKNAVAAAKGGENAVATAEGGDNAVAVAQGGQNSVARASGGHNAVATATGNNAIASSVSGNNAAAFASSGGSDDSDAEPFTFKPFTFRPFHFKPFHFRPFKPLTFPPMHFHDMG